MVVEAKIVHTTTFYVFSVELGPKHCQFAKYYLSREKQVACSGRCPSADRIREDRAIYQAQVVRRKTELPVLVVRYN